ncbi:MAG: inositol monophosphatase family protein [Kiritimatiellia bacterium]
MVTMTENINDLLECAKDAARAGGTHALNNPGRRQDTILDAAHDVKLELDVECQERVLEVIRSRFPDHSILGEEDKPGSSAQAADGTCRWIVDPIDGTVNFFHRLPIWCCSVAAELNGRTVAAAVYAPELGELYEASEDGEALCNGKAISVSRTASIEKAMIYTGMDIRRETGSRPLGLFEKLVFNTQKARIVGSAALDLCRIARGQGDGYFETGIFVWDIAAAALILERAGGKAELLREMGNGRLVYLATNGRIHEQLKAVMDTGT